MKERIADLETRTGQSVHGVREHDRAEALVEAQALLEQLGASSAVGHALGPQLIALLASPAVREIVEEALEAWS